MPWIYKILIGIAVLYLLVCIGYYFFQEKIIFHPHQVPKDLKYEYPIPYQELFLNTPDGETLNAVYCPVDQPKGLVIYFHGNAAHLYELGYVAGIFSDLGYDLFMMDYRSYGKSSGQLSEENLHKDAELCYQWIVDNTNYKAEQISIYGRSIGSGVATRLASVTKQARLVLESPYYSVEDLGQYYTPFLPYKWLVRYPLRSGEYIKNVKSPVTILHGKKDTIVPFASGKKLSEAAPTLLEFYQIEEAGHNDMSQFEEFYLALSNTF